MPDTIQSPMTVLAIATIAFLAYLFCTPSSTIPPPSSSKVAHRGESPPKSPNCNTSVSLKTSFPNELAAWDMGWDPTVYNPWAIFGLVMPHDGIIVDEGYFHDCCDRTTTYYMQNGGADMRTLAYARQSCLFLSAFCQTRKMEIQRLKSEASTVAHDESQRIEELEGRLRDAELAASCAPTWFLQFMEFTATKCSRGASLRVGSAELHEAFVDYLARHHRDVAAPPHKALRELMENQGYLYEQLYINGANTRGFKGIGLSRDRTEETFK